MAKFSGSSKKGSSAKTAAKAAVGGALVGAAIAKNSNNKSSNVASQSVAKKKSKWSWIKILVIIFFIALSFFIFYGIDSVLFRPKGFISSYI
jgi:hypothetical protein